ncbi:hypothetical protein ElyMa_004663000 [Elysia marginata]|uniref:Uncharacterized protein n=1 Tax=Elysia marginata TaxID=1093978 RepID=A0AAV4I6E0_9GAST|nr:hypothetical protein ElyMa_004663000 [Elysia marginata]
MADTDQLPKGGAGTAGSASCTTKTTTTALHPHLLQMLTDSKSNECTHQKLELLFEADNGSLCSSAATPPNYHPRISNMGTENQENRLGFQAYYTTPEHIESTPNLHICSSLVHTTAVKPINIRWGNTSNAGRRGTMKNRGRSVFNSCNHTIMSKEKGVLSPKEDTKDQQLCNTCLCQGCLKSACSLHSIFSSAKLLCPTYSKYPSLTRRNPLHRIFLFLGLFLCALHVVSGAGTVIRAPASKPVCLHTFIDERSKALQADVVIEGKVRKSLTVDPKTGYFDRVVAVRRTILKGSAFVAPGREKKQDKHIRLRIGPFKNGTDDAKNCVASVMKGRTYFFYLRDIGHQKGLRFKLMAIPTKRTRALRNSLRGILCKGCDNGPYHLEVMLDSKLKVDFPHIGGELDSNRRLSSK